MDVPFLLWLIMTLRSYFPKRLGQVAPWIASSFSSRRCVCRAGRIASAESRRWRLSCAKCAYRYMEPDQGRGRAPRGHGAPRVFAGRRAGFAGKRGPPDLR